MINAFVLEKNLDQLVFDTIERAVDIDSIAALDALFAPSCDALGCTHLGAFSVREPTGQMVAGFQCGNTDADWSAHYVETKLFEADGVVRLLPHTLDPMVWSELLEHENLSDHAKEVFHQARSFGLRDGLVLPQHYVNGAVVATILTFPDTLTRSARERAALTVLGTWYGASVRRLMAPGPPASASKLTKRQRECLQWVRAGKSDKEIAGILNISEHTVIEHLEAARKRLGVRNRTQAVLEAIQQRLISL